MTAMFPALGIDLERRLLVILVQLTVIVLAARLFGFVFRKIKQPSVVGEIAAGLVLGPSLLGWLFPDLSALIFLPDTDPIGRDAAQTLKVISQLGLIFLLFLMGLEFDFSHLKTNARSAFGISFAGIGIPMFLGMGLAQYLYPRVGSGADYRGFILFLGVSMSITALPVLARMMDELRITRTRLGTITITAAASDDAAGWILLATVSAMVTASFHLWLTVRMIALTIGFTLFLVYAAKPFLCTWIRKTLKRNNGTLSSASLAIILCILFLCSIATSLIGIFAIFGAFLLGTILSEEQEFRIAISGILRDFVMVFFLPIFFTYTGLRTNIGLLETAELWYLALLVFLVAILGKLGGCSLAARLSGFSGKESLLVGSMMNTRGLMELIVLNVGFDLGVIPQSLFTMLVLMALLTTMMTTPLLYLFANGTELELHLREWFGMKNDAGEKASRSSLKEISGSST